MDRLQLDDDALAVAEFASELLSCQPECEPGCSQRLAVLSRREGLLPRVSAREQVRLASDEASRHVALFRGASALAAPAVAVAIRERACRVRASRSTASSSSYRRRPRRGDVGRRGLEDVVHGDAQECGDRLLVCRRGIVLPALDRADRRLRTQWRAGSSDSLEGQTARLPKLTKLRSRRTESREPTRPKRGNVGAVRYRQTCRRRRHAGGSLVHAPRTLP